MAHRARSRTAESAENKKTKVTPRRLTEKIAIMRRREHEQSEAFQKAMKSIFEACTVTPVCVLLSAYVHMKTEDLLSILSVQTLCIPCSLGHPQLLVRFTVKV